ncbi:hypothetical protein QYF36_022076 [Acer negundo]|nr:hypothetical protein QYF36_022076 [Acer negundo]
MRSNSESASRENAKFNLPKRKFIISRVKVAKRVSNKEKKKPKMQSCDMCYIHHNVGSSGALASIALVSLFLPQWLGWLCLGSWTILPIMQARRFINQKNYRCLKRSIVKTTSLARGRFNRFRGCLSRLYLLFGTIYEDGIAKSSSTKQHSNHHRLRYSWLRSSVFNRASFNFPPSVAWVALFGFMEHFAYHAGQPLCKSKKLRMAQTFDCENNFACTWKIQQILGMSQVQEGKFSHVMKFYEKQK